MIENKVLKTIKHFDMLRRGDKVVVAVSGGVDSTALLDILDSLKGKLQIKLFVAHLNHKIRKGQSDLDEAFVKSLAKKYNFPCTAEEFDVPQFAKKNKMNLEDAARRIRYEFLSRVAAKYGAGKIALAHTADDNIETFLMRLIRGAGLKGLESIPAVRGNIIRPMIELLREDIQQYLKSRKIKPRIDLTNLDTKYLRNRVRHDLLPALKSYNRNIKEVLLRTIHAVSDDQSFIEHESGKSLAGAKVFMGSGEIRLDVNKLLRFKHSIQAGAVRLAIEHVKQDLIDVTFVHIEDILKIITKKRAELVLPGVHVLVNKGVLIISNSKPLKAESKPFMHKLEIPGKTNIDEAGIIIESDILDHVSPRQLRMKDPYQAYLDYDKIGKPLIVRSKQKGDVFSPLGLKGRKKLQDIFIDEKVDLEHRDKVPLLDDGKNIVWVVGYRVSERTKVTPGTKKIVRLTARHC